MYSALAYRELGVDPPSALSLSLQDQADVSLCMPPVARVVPPLASHVTCNHLDTVTHQYALLGTANGKIYCIDLDRVYNDKASGRVLCNDTFAFISTPSQYSITAIQWYTNDTGMFFSSSVDRFVRIHDTNTQEIAWRFPFSDPVKDIAVSQCSTHSSLIAVALDHTSLRLCDIRSGSCTHQLMGSSSQSHTRVMWSNRDGNLLCAGGSNGTVMFWDVRKTGMICYLDKFNTGRRQNVVSSLYRHHNPSSKSHVSRVRNGHEYYSSTRDESQRMDIISTSSSSSLSDHSSRPDMDQLKILREHKRKKRMSRKNRNTLVSPVIESPSEEQAHTGAVYDIIFSPDGLNLFTYGADQVIRSWDTMTGICSTTKYRRNRNSNRSSNFRMSISSSGSCLFVPQARVIDVFECESGLAHPSLSGHFANVSGCFYRPGYEQLFSYGLDKELLCWMSTRESRLFSATNNSRQVEDGDAWSDDD